LGSLFVRWHCMNNPGIRPHQELDYLTFYVLTPYTRLTTGLVLRYILGGRRIMSMKFTAVITKEDNWHVAHCVELGVVSQGKTIEEAQVNLKEAVELYIESFGVEDIPESKGEVVFYPLEIAVSG